VSRPARNSSRPWSHDRQGRGRRVEIAAEFAIRGLLGRVARLVILTRVLRDGRLLLDDLEHYVEAGARSPREQSRSIRRSMS
jgi:hypothetical protein